MRSAREGTRLAIPTGFRPKPRVASNELPWVIDGELHNPNGVAPDNSMLHLVFSTTVSEEH
jgi:hypothetical protein